MGNTRPASRMGAVVLAIFVNAGSLKSHPLLSWIPGDLTALMAIFLGLAILLAITKRMFIPGTVWVAIVIALSTVGGLLEPLGGYGQEKATHFYTLTLLAMFAASFLLQDERQRSAFLTATAIIGATVAALVLIDPAHPAAWSSVVALPGTNTIATSRMILAGVIAILLQALLSKKRAGVRIALLALSVGMVLVALNTGSRGPIVAAAFGIVLALLFARAFVRRRFRSVLLIAAMLAAGWAFAAQSTTQGLDRILTFIEGNGDSSTAARSRFWEIAASNIPDVPLGGGWGYFGELAYGADGISAYPHNSVLEITLEAGWLAGLVFAIFAVAALARYVAGSLSPTTVAMLALFVFALLNSLVSGDVNDNRLMWVLLVAAFLIKKGAVATDAVHPAPISTRGAQFSGRSHQSSQATA